MKPKIQAVFFDMDGTLVETEGLATATVQSVFSQFGTRISAEDCQEVIGRKWEVALRFLFERYQPPVSPQQVGDEIKLEYRKRMESSLREIPGATAAVEWMAARLPIALVTGSNRRDALWVLDRLGIRSHFSHILAAEDYSESKPSPEGYLKAAQLLAVDPASCLVFEDSAPGIQSARDAGMQVVAVSRARVVDGVEQDQSQAHGSVQDFREVDVRWLENWIKSSSA